MPLLNLVHAVHIGTTRLISATAHRSRDATPRRVINGTEVPGTFTYPGRGQSE